MRRVTGPARRSCAPSDRVDDPFEMFRMRPAPIELPAADTSCERVVVGFGHRRKLAGHLRFVDPFQCRIAAHAAREGFDVVCDIEPPNHIDCLL